MRMTGLHVHFDSIIAYDDDLRQKKSITAFCHILNLIFFSSTHRLLTSLMFD